jgi:hypothetical protein
MRKNPMLIFDDPQASVKREHIMVMQLIKDRRVIGREESQYFFA